MGVFLIGFCLGGVCEFVDGLGNVWIGVIVVIGVDFGNCNFY